MNESVKSKFNGTKTKYFVILVVFLAILIRLYNLSSPPFDLYAHAMRQSQTLSTIEDFYINGINIFSA